jgi:hypothetical protein
VNRKYITVVILAIMLSPAHPASALTRFETAKPKGIYLALGLGYGSSQAHFDRNTYLNGQKATPLLHFRVGLAVGKRVLVGFEHNEWLRELDDRTYGYALSSISATYYLAKNVFLRAGPALGIVSYSYANYDDFKASYYAVGLGYGLAIGSDIRITRAFSFVPEVQYLRMSLKCPKMSASVVSIVLAVGWFW